MKIFDERLDVAQIRESSFKEDSVREEIIAPILKHLGYSAFTENKIVRSQSLAHPYIQFGTRREHISIIPDYLLQVDGKNFFFLDAKAPSENIRTGKNPEQAFSYAIHRDVRVEKYALCNGLEFVVFDIKTLKPILCLRVDEIEEKWDELYRVLSPLAFTKPYIFNYKPDFGLWCIKAGFPPDSIQHFIDCGVGQIGKVDENTYTFTLGIPTEEMCLASFDFDKKLFEAFLQQVPSDKRDHVKFSLTHQPFCYTPRNESELLRIDFSATLGSQAVDNGDEVFVPLRVQSFGFTKKT